MDAGQAFLSWSVAVCADMEGLLTSGKFLQEPCARGHCQAVSVRFLPPPERCGAKIIQAPTYDLVPVLPVMPSTQKGSITPPPGIIGVILVGMGAAHTEAVRSSSILTGIWEKVMMQRCSSQGEHKLLIIQSPQIIFHVCRSCCRCTQSKSPKIVAAVAPEYGGHLHIPGVVQERGSLGGELEVYAAGSCQPAG